LKRTFLLFLVFYAGFCSMGLEMAAARLLAPYFGTSNYIWTNVIGIILVALSLGYWLGGRLADRRPRLGVLAALLVAGGLLGMGIPFALRPLAGLLLPPTLTLDQAFLLVFKGSLVGACLFAPTILLAGTTSPFVIKLLTMEGMPVGEATGRAFALSTAGSLLGIFATTLFLVPAVGSVVTVVVLSGMLVALPACILAWPSRRLAALLLLAAPVAAATRFPLKQTPGQLGEWESSYQYIQVREQGDTRFLSLNEGLDSFHSVLVEGEYLTDGRYYDYYNAFPFLFDGEDRLDVCILGGGGGTSARQILHFFGDRFDVRIDAVEIDPLVTEIGRRYFDYPRERVTVFDLDARVFVNLARTRYDLILVDAYAQQIYIPFHVATREFFERVRGLLRPRGVVAMNVGAFRPDLPLVEALVATVRSVFPRTYTMEVPLSRNLVLFALEGFGDEDLRRALEAAERGPLAAVTASVALGAHRVEEAPAGAPVLTDAHAPVEWLTDRMVRRRAQEELR